jgi:NAD(P)H-flavin reductase
LKLCVLNDRISVDIEKDTRENEHALYKMKTLQIRSNSHIEGVNPALSILSDSLFLCYATNIMSKKIDNVSEWNDICICGPTVVSKSCTTEIIRELVAGSHQNMN